MLIDILFLSTVAIRIYEIVTIQLTSARNEGIHAADSETIIEDH